MRTVGKEEFAGEAPFIGQGGNLTCVDSEGKMLPHSVDKELCEKPLDREDGLIGMGVS